MTINIIIPAELEQAIRASTPDLDQHAREAVLVDLYRRGKIFHKQFADALGLDRWGAEELLHLHGVSSVSPEDIDKQFETIKRTEH